MKTTITTLRNRNLSLGSLCLCVSLLLLLWTNSGSVAVSAQPTEPKVEKCVYAPHPYMLIVPSPREQACSCAKNGTLCEPNDSCYGMFDTKRFDNDLLHRNSTGQDYVTCFTQPCDNISGDWIYYLPTYPTSTVVGTVSIIQSNCDGTITVKTSNGTDDYYFSMMVYNGNYVMDVFQSPPVPMTSDDYYDETGTARNSTMFEGKPQQCVYYGDFNAINSMEEAEYHALRRVPPGTTYTVGQVMTPDKVPNGCSADFPKPWTAAGDGGTVTTTPPSTPTSPSTSPVALPTATIPVVGALDKCIYAAEPFNYIVSSPREQDCSCAANGTVCRPNELCFANYGEYATCSIKPCDNIAGDWIYCSMLDWEDPNTTLTVIGTVSILQSNCDGAITVKTSNGTDLYYFSMGWDGVYYLNVFQSPPVAMTSINYFDEEGFPRNSTIFLQNFESKEPQCQYLGALNAINALIDEEQFDQPNALLRVPPGTTYTLGQTLSLGSGCPAGFPKPWTAKADSGTSNVTTPQSTPTSPSAPVAVVPSASPVALPTATIPVVVSKAPAAPVVDSKATTAPVVVSKAPTNAVVPVVSPIIMTSAAATTTSISFGPITLFMQSVVLSALLGRFL